MQDGNNSAVTGGIGSESLTVYCPAFNLKKTSGKNALALNLGADVISSASTDRIDYVMSSASRVDTRYYANTVYEYNFDKKNLVVSGGAGFSIESDYFSLSGKVGVTKEDKNNNRSFSAQFQIFDDDLRWGRLNPDYYRPVKLIYPVELRYKEWYDEYKRYSCNLILGYTQILNSRNILGLFPGITCQTGLLATPFHRIYFQDGTEGVEQLPDERWKGSLALRLNSFVRGNLILKNTVNGYADNFGILGLSFEDEVAVRIGYVITLLPNARFYTQRGSGYFAGYGKHQNNETYFTSDFDLSSFKTCNIGIGFKYSPFSDITKKLLFNSLLFRYNFMYRTNRLFANIFSLSFRTEFLKPSKNRNHV